MSTASEGDSAKSQRARTRGMMMLKNRVSQQPAMNGEDAKTLLAEGLRANVYPHLLRLRFETKRPNAKRAGRFPVHYFRKRDNDLDLLWFTWRSAGRPRFVIEFEIIRTEEGIAEFRNHGWQMESHLHRDVGGRIVERTHPMLFGENWFGFTWLDTVRSDTRWPKIVTDVTSKTTKRLDDVDKFMKGFGPFPMPGHNWNLPLAERFNGDQNRCLTKADATTL